MSETIELPGMIAFVERARRQKVDIFLYLPKGWSEVWDGIEIEGRMRVELCQLRVEATRIWAICL